MARDPGHEVAARAASDSSLRAARIQRRQRSSGDRERVEGVNQYALWCIRNGMWNEARSHLEQAVQRDSLAASLNNNLAIVCEHFGQRTEAARYYARALALEPDNDQYSANLKRLNELERAVTDTTGSIDMFELRRRTPGEPGSPARPE
ncbi:MAG: hypothetical protein AB1505_30615 [Candidatus Latescibacterota bacterium]